MIVDGHEWGFRHVSIGNPQCSIRVGSEQELRRSTSPAIGPPIADDPRFPNRTNVSWYTELAGRQRGQAAHPRADLRARGGGDAVLRHRRERRGGRLLPKIRRPRPGTADGRRLLDGGELEVEVGEDLQVTLTGWARPVFAGRAQRGFRKGAA